MFTSLRASLPDGLLRVGIKEEHSGRILAKLGQIQIELFPKHWFLKGGSQYSNLQG